MPYIENRPYTLNTNDIFVVYPIKQESTYEYMGEYFDKKKVFKIKNKITVGFNKRLVYRELQSLSDEDNYPKYRYIDLITLDSLFVREEISSSEFYYTTNPRENLEEFGLPISIRSFANNYGFEIDSDEVKTHHVIDLFKRINKIDKDREAVVLSFEVEKAEKQIDSIFVKKNSEEKNVVIEKK